MKRKGISPLIAAVLLIAFTLAVAAILTAWVTTFTQDTTDQIGNRTDQLISCSYAGMSIYSAVYDGDVVTVSVANTGTRDLSNVTVNVFTDTGQVFDGFIQSLNTGNVGTDDINVSSGVTYGDLDRVRVASTECAQTTDTETSITDAR